MRRFSHCPRPSRLPWSITARSIIAKLDIDKSKWTLAQTKTKRFPAINTYLFASGDITSPTFSFPAGSFGFR